MKKFVKKLNAKSLDMVVGGNLAESLELLYAFQNNGLLKELNPDRRVAESDLKNCLTDIGIDSKLCFNLFGGKKNIYIDIKTGNNLTHKEVVQRVRQSRP